MKNLFNEDDFNSLFENSVIDAKGQGPEGNRETPKVGATKGMQSDFDSMFDELFNDLGDDQSKPVGKQEDTGASGGSIDPEPTDNGKGGLTPPTKSEWDSLFADGGESDDEGSNVDGDVAGMKLPKKKCHGNGGKKLKSDFESLFEDDDVAGSSVDDPETDPADAGSTDDVPAPKGKKAADDDVDDEVEKAADEFADLMSDIDDLEMTGF